MLELAKKFRYQENCILEERAEQAKETAE